MRSVRSAVRGSKASTSEYRVRIGNVPSSIVYSYSCASCFARHEVLLAQRQFEGNCKLQEDDSSLRSRCNVSPSTEFVGAERICSRSSLRIPRFDILPALKREDSHGTAPLGWDGYGL